MYAAFVILLCVKLVGAYSDDNCAATPARWHANMGWCWHAGSKLHIGDFNGDGRSDMLCHDTAGNIWVALATTAGEFTTTTWYSPEKWCYHAGAQLFVGDFNGDKRADILCHDTAGQKWIKYGTVQGDLSGPHWYLSMGWCYHAGAQLFIGDFNGDGKDDLLCHDSNNGHKWVAFANILGQFTTTSWEKGLGWCWHAGARLYVGDFNGDRRADILCSDSNGNKWIYYANQNGMFERRWDREQNTGPWCNEGPTVIMRIADVNGDRQDDMVCHTSGGETWVAFALPDGTFTSQNSFYKPGWCSLGEAGFFTGYFSKDGRADLLCHGYGGYNGQKWILYSQCPFA